MTSVGPEFLPFTDELNRNCKRCGESKPLDEFYIDKRDGKPKQPCKGCWKVWEERSRATDEVGFLERRRARGNRYRQNHLEKARDKDRRIRENKRHAGILQAADRANNLKSKYRITLEQFNALYEAQDGLCACCGEPPRDDEILHVDHDHNCCPGKRSCGQCIRGLIHNSCNRAMGLLCDDPDRILHAARYLIDHAEKKQREIDV